MSSINEHYLSLPLRSDPRTNDGYYVKDSNSNATAVFRLDDPIRLPPEAFNIRIYLHSFNIYNVFPNITQSKQNQILYITDDTLNMTKYQITLGEGLWSPSGINEQIRRSIEINSLTAKCIELFANTNTQKIDIKVAQGHGIKIDTNGPYALLGWSAPFEIKNNTAQVVYQSAPDLSDFTANESIYLCSDLVNDSLIHGTENVVGVIPISKGQSEFIRYDASTPLYVNAIGLKDGIKSKFTVEVRNQNFELLDCKNQPWGARLVIVFNSNQARLSEF
jgi:hypothetical protein